MRKILAAALMATALSGAAFAADLPSRTAPVFAPPPPPVFTWTGGYIGVNAGYAFDYLGRFETFNGNGPTATGVNTDRAARAGVGSEGFTAGGQVGYNYQFGAGSGIVVGLEADAAYTDIGDTRTFSVNSPALSRIHSEMDFLGTVRGRVGYAFDRFLVYGTGGFAYGDVSNRSTFYGVNNLGAVANNVSFVGGKSGMQYGYTYGGGVEYAVPTDSFLSSLNFFHSSAVTIKAEFLHYDLGDSRYAVNAVGNANTNAYSQRVKTDGDLARIGINYKF